METFDKQRQVWQRVTAEPTRSRENGAGLILPAMVLLSAYRQLSASVPEAKPLAESQADTVACLKGLTRLQGGAAPNPRLPLQEKETREKLLLRCYRHSRTACAEYLARSADPETGVVFRFLSERQEQHCAMIAALLGKL